MSTNIHATEKALEKIFSNDFVFTIPPYQRPYSWTTEQAGELLSDLLSFLGNETGPISEANPYFLGSIVLIKPKNNDPNADVVDGQQRLTTLTILLSVMRSLISSGYSAQLTEYIYEKGNLITGTPDRYRLKLRARDNDFFCKHIQQENGLESLFQLDRARLTDSQRNMQANAQYLHEKTSEMPEEKRLRLLSYIIKRSYLVVVATPDLESAYRIFSVLNARGLDLSFPDLLKSEIIGALPPEEREKYTKIWEGEEDDLGRDAFQDLFSHIRMIHQKAKLRKSVISEFREIIKPQENPKLFIDEVLKPHSDSFEMIKKASYQSMKGAEEVNALFRWLNQIENSDWIPPSIQYLSRHGNSPDKLKNFFVDLERLAAGMMILQTDVYSRIERYGEVLKYIEREDDLYCAESPLQLTEREAAGITTALNGDVYLMSRGKQYILLRLDAALAEGVASYDYQVVTVEHILPQKPAEGSIWFEWFPDSSEREKYVHCIGNLALLSRRKNSQVQNWDFKKKKKKYFAAHKGISPFALTTQVLQETEWTPAVISRRQEQLMQKLKELWRL